MKGRFVKIGVILACVLALIAPASTAFAVAGSSNDSQVAGLAHSTTKKVHRWGPYFVDAPPPRLEHPLPFRINATALAAVGACLLALSLWGGWQTRHRCTSCGYCPIYCRCDEIESR